MILIVEPDAAAARALASPLARLDKVRQVATSLAARRTLARRDESWSLLVVRADDAWEEAVNEARECNAGVGVLLVDEMAPKELVRRAFARGVTLTSPPIVADEITSFARRYIGLASKGPAAVDGAVSRLAAEHAFRPHELRLLQLAVEGRPRRQIATDMSVSENTVKSQIRMLLRRCGGRKLSDLARMALRLAAASAPSPITISNGIGNGAADATSSTNRDAV
jgi:DNA-binding NarL/FixJ family response regulator